LSRKRRRIGENDQSSLHAEAKDSSIKHDKHSFKASEGNYQNRGKNFGSRFSEKNRDSANNSANRGRLYCEYCNKPGHSRTHCAVEKAKLHQLLKGKATKPVSTIVCHTSAVRSTRLSDDIAALSLKPLVKTDDPDSYTVDRMFVVSFEVVTQTRPIRALVDSGANSQNISRRVLQELGLEHKTESCKRPILVFSAFNLQYSIKESITITLKAKQWIRPIQFFVLDDCPADAILGLPFIDKYADEFDWKRKTFAGVKARLQGSSVSAAMLCSVLLLQGTSRSSWIIKDQSQSVADDCVLNVIFFKYLLYLLIFLIGFFIIAYFFDPLKQVFDLVSYFFFQLKRDINYFFYLSQQSKRDCNVDEPTEKQPPVAIVSSVLSAYDNNDERSRFHAMSNATSTGPQISLNCMLVDRADFRRASRPSTSHFFMALVTERPDAINEVTNPDRVAVLQEYPDVVTNESPSQLPPLSRVTHNIDLLAGKPPSRPPYRLSMAEQKVMQEEIESLLAKGYIEPSVSPYSAPVLFVKKSDGSLRMCVDYRLLNQQTVKNKFPLPVIADILDRLGGAKWFSKLDLMSGYHQIRVNPTDEPKTGFSTPRGHYQFRVMPFGLTNAPATFQAHMNDVFSPFLNKFVEVYLDDILIYSRTLEEHKEHVRQVMEALRDARLIAKQSKCMFFVQKVPFLGFEVSNEGVTPLANKVKAVAEFPKPRTAKQALSFLGLANYYRRFVKNFSRIVRPLYEFANGHVKWDSEQDEAFEKLKTLLSSPPVLIMPDFEQDFWLTTDASDEGLAAVLENRTQKGKLLGVVSYWSRAVKPQEKKYTVREKECLAIVDAMKFFRHILLGREFIVRTDHFSLTYLLSQQKTPQHRIARWIDTLAEYNFRIRHLSGNKNSAADALSRVPHSTAETAEEKEEERHFIAIINSMEMTNSVSSEYAEVIKKALPKDPDFGEMYEALQNDKVPKEFRANAEHYCIFNDLLYYDVTVGQDNNDLRLCIPAGFLRARLLAEAHDAPISGHFSFYRSYLILASRYYWPRMHRDMQNHVYTCDICQRVNMGKPGTKGLLRPLELPAQRWESISMDFITGFPKAKGFDGLYVVVDRLSKRAHFVPHRKKDTTKDVANSLIWNVFRLHGFPSSIVSDRDPRFNSELWRHFTERLGVQLKMSTSNHAATDGQTERVNRIIRRMLKVIYQDNDDSWYDAIPVMEFAYNNSFQESIGSTPFLVDLGIQPRTPSLVQPLLRDEKFNQEAEDLVLHMEAILLRTRDSLVEAQRKQERNANAHRSELIFKSGDKVLVRHDAFVRSANFKKTHPLYHGPFTVRRGYGDNAYRLDCPEKKSLINVKFLKPYHLREEYGSIPPKSEEEAQHFKSMIKAVVGFDRYSENNGQVVQTYDLQFKDCDPSITLTVSHEFFLTLPARQRQLLMQDFMIHLPQESETILNEGGDSVTELV
jgi:hypothetical protein